MSMIAGAVYFGGASADRHHLDAVLQAYAHLGPDGRHAWTQDSFGLAHWKRHGTPQSRKERLPLANEQDGLAITAESRLDNRDELFEAFCIKPSERATISDSQLILRAYQKWGECCPEHLEGDFSFAICDRRRGSLICVQSAFPIQPLYYHQTGGCFAFGSLIRPLLSLARIRKQLNEGYLARHITRAILQPQSNPADRFETPFAGVRALPPATVLVVSREGVTRLRQWWNPDPTREVHLSNDQEYYDLVRDLMLRSVHDRMRTDLPIVACLSGGLDSSTITCIAARKLRDRGERLTTLSSVLPLDHVGPEKDEREFIDIVKHAENLDVKYLNPHQSMSEDDSRYFDFLEAPGFSFKGYVYKAFHEAAAACGAGVILDGCGGELGPTNHASGLIAYLARRGQWGLVRRELSGMSRMLGVSSFGLFVREIVAPHLPGLKSLYQRFKNPQSQKMVWLPLNGDFARRHQLRRSVESDNPPLNSLCDPKKQIALNASRMQLGKLSQASMAYGIRTVFPFFDRRVIDCCLAVPARLYQVDGCSRNLIRRSMEGILPPQIQWRQTKAPFSPDFIRRFLSERAAIRNEFASLPASDVARDYYDVDRILSTIDQIGVRPGREGSYDGMLIKYCVQSSLTGIRFLHWFDRINVDVAPFRRAA